MRIGIVNEESWGFFNDVYSEFIEHHEVTIFKRRTFNPPIFQNRLNDYVFSRNFQHFLKHQDVVFFEWASELLVTATRMPKSCGIVTRLHRYELYQWADQICWDLVDRIILVSKAKQHEFVARFPGYASKTKVIPVGIQFEKFHPKGRTFNGDIGILCHLTPRKRVYELILAFYQLIKMRDGFHLHIGGGRHPRFGDYYEAIHNLVLKLRLNDRVTFYDHVTHPEDWYPEIDIFISNSYSEGLQVSPMEAIASGCYSLSHYWNGADELLPEENLYLTDQELIVKILEYSDLTVAEKQSRNTQLQAFVRDRFDSQKIKSQIRQIVEEVRTRAVQV